MFSNNRKISARQLQRLVVLDWIGKAGLLLPRFAERASGRDFFLSLLGAILLTLCYAWVVGFLAGKMEQGFYEYMKERLGPGSAWFVTVLYILYAFVNTIFLVRLFASIAVFVLPETSQTLLIGMVLLAGIYIVAGGLEVRARVGEILFSIVLYPLLAMLLVAAFSINPDYLSPGQVQVTVQTLKHSMQIFILLGGMGIFLYIVPYLNEKKGMGRAIRRAVFVTGGALLAFLVVVMGSFGEAGMRALPWPLITLMSSVEIPGGFLQRWDVIFTGLLLTGFFLAVSTGLFYMKFLTVTVFQKERRWYLPVLGCLVFAAALWCEDCETAAQVFLWINGYLLVPAAVIFSIFLAVIEYVKGRKR